MKLLPLILENQNTLKKRVILYLNKILETKFEVLYESWEKESKTKFFKVAPLSIVFINTDGLVVIFDPTIELGHSI